MTTISAISSTTGSYRMPPPSGDRDPMSAVAAKLGLSSDDLKSELSSGKSLAEVATAQGVSHDDLITAIKAGMPAEATDATEMAEKIAGTKGMPPPPGGAACGPRGNNTGVSDSSKLDQLSQLLEMDSDEVADQATSASDLVKLLQSKGVDLDRLRDVLTSGDLIDTAA